MISTSVDPVIGQSEGPIRSPSSPSKFAGALVRVTRDVIRSPSSLRQVEHEIQSLPILDTIAVAAITTSSTSSALTMHHAIETPEIMTDIRNQMAITEALTKANHMLETNRAKNTRKAYAPKKKLWKAWCREQGFSDGDAVTEGKLVLFLQKVVFVNGSQARGKRKGAMLSPQGVEGYVKPVVDLYVVYVIDLLILNF
jgi:hypothetical protein